MQLIGAAYLIGRWSMTLPEGELERVTNQWQSQDEKTHTRRVALLRKMSDLRTINECMAEWTNSCKQEWEDLNKQEDEEHTQRLKWNNSNIGIASSYVPTLKTFHSHQKVGANPMNEAPHFFDTVCISTQASKFAWDSVMSGQCSADLSTSGGKAVDSLFHMLSDAKKQWKPSAVSTSKNVDEFDWNSHSYDHSAQRASVEAKLELSETNDTVELPREYRNDVQFYLRAASNPDQELVSAPTTTEDKSIVDDLLFASNTMPVVPAVNDKFSKMKLTNSASKPHSVSSSSWWSTAHWSAA